jgi:hypothetical protein
MNDQPDPGQRIREAAEALREKIAKIAREKHDVRKRVADVVASASSTLGEGGAELKRVSTAVLDAAVAAAAKSTDSVTGTGTLREVVDGVGDGLAAAAQAAKLAIDEARSSGKHFADEDLQKVADEFQALGQVIVESLESAVHQVKGHLAEQSSTIREHAERTLERVRPSLEAAARTAAGSPGAFTKESGAAGAAATKEAVGALFTELGALLQRTGTRLRGEGDQG